MDKVSRRFVSFESMLKQEDASSPRFKVSRILYSLILVISIFKLEFLNIEHSSFNSRTFSFSAKSAYRERVTLLFISEADSWIYSIALFLLARICYLLKICKTLNMSVLKRNHRTMNR